MQLDLRTFQPINYCGTELHYLAKPIQSAWSCYGRKAN